MEKTGDHAEVCKRIEGLFKAMSPQLRQAARFVLDRPDDVALQSMRELAGNAGVHPSTMMRLAKTVGYPGFQAFREPFRTRLRGPTARYTARARELQARGLGGDDDPYGTLLAEMLANDLGNLRETFESIGFDQLVASGEILGDARRIYVVGLRSCYPIAFYFHYACRVFSTNVDLLDGRGGTFSDGLRGVGPEDAILAVSIAPYTRETIEVVRYAAQRKARIVVITDSPVAPLAADADKALFIASASPSFFQSLVPAMAVVQSLVAVLLARGGEAALAALADSEGQLHDFRVYWDEGGGGPAARRPADKATSAS